MASAASAASTARGDVGVFIVHGMGTQTPDFWRPLASSLEQRLRGLGVAAGRVTWCGGYWANLLTKEEHDLWTNALRGGPLSFDTLRQFLVNAFGDAVAYRREPAGLRSVYREIHDAMLAALESLRHDLGDADKPLIVMAHSLGSVIMSDYIWNAQTNNAWARGKHAFERMQTLSGLITFGSTIPLFSLALPEVVAIAFPPPELPGTLATVAEWHNYYDRQDVLGWPIKTLSPSYQRVVTADHEINVGNVLESWNPLSHVAYWTDPDFVDPAAGQIKRVLDAVAD